jgi:hypothetical protein
LGVSKQAGGGAINGTPGIILCIQSPLALNTRIYLPFHLFGHFKGKLFQIEGYRDEKENPVHPQKVIQR